MLAICPVHGFELFGQCSFPEILEEKVVGRYLADEFVASPTDSLAYDQWTDLSGNDNHFASGTDPSLKPTYLPDTLNGKGALFLDGNDEMQMPNEIELGASYVLYSWDGDVPFDDFKGLLVRPGGPGDYRVFFTNNGTTAFWPNGFMGPNFVTNNQIGLEITNIDNFNSTYGFRSTSQPMNQLVLGRDFAGVNRRWEGKVVELILFNQALTETEHNLLQDYIRCTYTPMPELPESIVTTDFCPIELNVDRNYFSHYIWSTGETSPGIDVTESGTYNVEAITIFNDTLSAEVEIQFPGDYIDDFSLCSGNDSVWQTNLEAYDLLWQDGSSSTDYLISEPGDYWFTVSDGEGCSFSTDTVEVLLDTFPDEVAIAYADPFCQGQFLDLNVGAGEIESILWNTGSTELTVVPDEEGQYWVWAENQNGCLAQDTVEVLFAGVAPDVQFSASALCELTEVQFIDESTLNDNSEITDIQWILGGDTLYGENVSYTFGQYGMYALQLNVLTDIGCNGVLKDSLQIHPLPDVQFEHSLGCTGQVTLFGDQSTIPEGALSIWLWDFGAGNTAITPEASFEFENPGNTEVSLTVQSVAGCENTETDTIPVYPAPVADFNWSNTCVGHIMYFQSTTDTGLTGSVNYAWNINGVAYSGPESQFLFQTAGEFPVTHQVWTTIDGVPGCFDEVSQNVVVSAEPQVQFTHSPACSGDSFTLTDESIAGQNDSIVSWQWTTQGMLLDTTASVDWVFEGTGLFPVTLDVTTLVGCESSGSDWVEVGAGEDPEIEFSPQIGLPPLEVEFLNSNSYGQTHFWFFGDGSTSDLEAPVYTYLDTGVYVVNLMVIDDAGCFGTAEATVMAIEPLFDIAVESVSCSLNDGLLTVSCIFANYGNHRLSSARFNMQTGNGAVVSELWEGDLPEGQLDTFTFQSSLGYNSEVNEPFVCVEASQPNGSSIDQVPENNQRCKSFSTKALEVFQPFPNPSDENLVQLFSLSRGADVTLRLVQPDGRIVEEFTERFGPGLNRFDWKTSHLSSGVYVLYVEVEDLAGYNKIMIVR